MNKTEQLARELFSNQDLEELHQAIAEAEKLTSGEIKLNFEYDVQQDPLLHARRIFEALGLVKTRERNATLIAVFLKDRKFAVLGDAGIHERVPVDFWQSIAARIETRFRAGQFKLGLLEGIAELSEKLAAYFPRQADDRDEIDNSIGGMGRGRGGEGGRG